MPNCAVGCPLNWLNDGYCDHSCNTETCLWDGGDCIENASISNENIFNNTNHNNRNQHNNKKHNPTHCAPSCLNNWLGDGSCDQICNNTNCAYDMMDCGIENFNTLFRIDIKPEQYYYYYESNATAIYLNFTLFNHIQDNYGTVFKMKIIDAKYSKVSFIRSSVLNERFQTLALLFYPHELKKNLILNITISFRKKLSHFILFLNTNDKLNLNDNNNNNQIFNYTKFNLTTLINEENKMIENSKNKFLLPRIVPIENCQLNGLSEEIKMKFDIIEKQLELFSKNNDNNTKQMENKKHNPVFYLKLKKLYEKLICDYNLMIENKRKLFSPLNDIENESNENEIETYFEELKSFKSRKLLDAYADSLVYVNFLYNKEFGVQVRNAPAHMAHFFDRDIMYRLQQRFPEQFEQTSSHRIRNSLDMQLAFSYFYFLMSEMKNLTLKEIIDKFDVDHSGLVSNNVQYFH